MHHDSCAEEKVWQPSVRKSWRRSWKHTEAVFLKKQLDAMVEKTKALEAYQEAGEDPKALEAFRC